LEFCTRIKQILIHLLFILLLCKNTNYGKAEMIIFSENAEFKNSYQVRLDKLGSI
jgi:hypothetical protein